MFYIQRNNDYLKIYILYSKVAERDHMISDLIPLLHNLANDEQDSVRLLSVDGCVAMAGICSHLLM